MFLDSIQLRDEIITWTRDDNGKLKQRRDKAPYYCYVKDPNGTINSIFGHPVSKKTFSNKSEMRNYCYDHPNKVFESDIKPVHKFLSDTFYGTTGKVNYAGLDIEVDFDLSLGKGYPDPDNPYGEINCVQLWDKSKNKYVMIMLTDKDSVSLSDDELEVECHYCSSEKEVLDTFYDAIKDIDILSAWFGDGFDIPYIVERSKLVYGETTGLTKLCRNGFEMKCDLKEDKYGNIRKQYTLIGRTHLDMKDLYINYTFGERDSYSLDFISEYEGVGRKNPYVGDLGKLYREDPQAFFEYALQDVRLLHKLEEKLKFLELAVTQSRRSTILLPEIFGSIKPLEYQIMNYCHFDRDEMLVLPDINRDNEKEEFGGGLVLYTAPDSYSWMSSIDWTSLYPTTIMALNISPETHLYQLMLGEHDFIKVAERRDEDVTIKDVKVGRKSVMTGAEIYDMIREYGYSISAHGSIFDGERIGIIPEVIQGWFDERVKTKAMSKQFYKDGDEEKGAYYDMLQNLRKLSLNSLYGAISNIHCRFYSLDLASSVTASGRMMNRFQAYKANELVQELTDGLKN